MPRLLVDGTFLSTAPKGVGRYSHQLLDQLCQKLPPDWSMSVIVIGREVARSLQIPRVSTVQIPQFSEITKGVIILPLLALCMRADLVLLPMEVVGLGVRRPMLIVIHDINAFIVSAAPQRIKTYARLKIWIREYLRARTIKKASAVVCNSEFTAAAAIKAYNLHENRIAISYCGVDSRFYAADSEQAQDWCSAIRQWNGFVLVFATGDPRERYDLLPAVWQRVHGQLPDLGLVVAGIRPGEDYVLQLENELSSRGLTKNRDYTFVDFLGDAGFAKLRSLYRAADFYVELSGHEGFGMQLAEAMATGTTCISSGRGALSEVGGVYAIQFAELETTHIADTLIKAYRDGLHSRDNTAQIEYTKRFSWDSVGDVVTRKLIEIQNRIEKL